MAEGRLPAPRRPRTLPRADDHADTTERHLCLARDPDADARITGSAAEEWREFGEEDSTNTDRPGETHSPTYLSTFRISQEKRGRQKRDADGRGRERDGRRGEGSRNGSRKYANKKKKRDWNTIPIKKSINTFIMELLHVNETD